MNKIYGKITLKETRVGIPDLLVIIYDIDPNTKPEDIISVSTSAIGINVLEQGFPGDRIGSVLTDENGVFEFTYGDGEFQIRNPKEKRPDLFVLVMAPEDPDRNLKTQILYVANNVRQNAGRSEQYLIKLGSKLLKESNIPLPTEPENNQEEPSAVNHRMNQDVERQDKIKKEALKIASEKVSLSRKRSQHISTELEKRLVEKLTNVQANQAERLNYVLPGADAEATAWKTFNNSIDNTINNQQPNTAYIVIPNAALPIFKNGDEFRDDITSAELEPFYSDAGENKQRPGFLLREDPTSLFCQSQTLPELLQDETDLETTNTTSTESLNTTNTENITRGEDASANPEDVPEYIARLMESMTSPEETVAFGVRQHANQDDLQNDLAAFELRTGPADKPRYYDFHNIQIAFDYVWQHAIDEGILEASSELYNKILDLGGDPLKSLQSDNDPIKALKKEAAITSRVHASGDIPSIIFKDNSDSTNGTGSSATNDVRNRFEDNEAPDNQVVKGEAYISYIDELLNEDYLFTVFAKGSTNFGLLTTYRQKWDPINYQVGDLIKTINLTPGEKRKLTSKLVINKERNVKEMENSLRVNKNDSSETSRAEAEIVKKAEDKTNFSLSSTGTYNLGIFKGDATTNFGKDAATSSQETKKAFRESVIKASQEYKDERKIEIDSKESFMEEETSMISLENTNNEITVNYLFYELQLLFHVSEHIHELRPVIFVAMDVPSPSRKSIKTLLLTHGWIINRVLLDDSFRQPLMYLSTQMVGDQASLKEMKNTLDAIRDLVNTLKLEQLAIRKNLAFRYDAYERALAERADVEGDEDTEGLLESAWEGIVGSGNEESLEAARLNEEATKEAFEKAEREEKQLRARLEREVTALNDATQAYAKENAKFLNRKHNITRLMIHVKKNILYYMQAIWSTTFKDQLFFELHKIKVPVLKSASQTFEVSIPDPIPANVVVGPDQTVLEVHANVTLESGLDPEQDFKTLAEVADLDNPMGFKGNYMIFPLKESNPLIDHMMMPYIDSELGLHDPDEFGNWTPKQFTEYVACLKENLEEPIFESLKTQLIAQYKRLVSSNRRAEEEIIVPSGSLYIEALLGTHKLIEDFKLLHRAIDVKKVQAEVRDMELENIRAAARLLAEEREDPDIEKTIVVQGGSNGGVNINP